MPLLEQIKGEIEHKINQQMLIIRERQSSPTANRDKEDLLAELRHIAAQKKPGEPIPPEFRERFSQVVTDLNIKYGMTQTEIAQIVGMRRQHISNYIRKTGEKKYFDESMVQKPEDKDSLLSELRQIKDKKISGKYIPPDLKERLSEIITKLNKSHGVNISDISDILDMDRNIVASYMHVYTGPEIKKQMPFTPGANPQKMTWWKRSGKSYKEMWSFAQQVAGVSPVITKSDYRKIAVEAVNYVNASEAVRNQLLDFIETEAYTTMQSASGYRIMVQIPVAFVQWLSERKGYEITLDDLDFESKRNPRGITASTGQRFTEDYVPEKPSKVTGEPARRSSTSQAHVRAGLIKFFKFLEVRGKIERYSMVGMRTAMERNIDVVAYNGSDLDEIFNKIISGKPAYFPLFLRLILQTGSRPGQIYPIKCKDLEFGVPVKDAFDRTFYPINTKKILQEEKERRGEAITKKFAPGTSFISERLKNDLQEWCKTNNLSGNDYIFKKFIQVSGIQEGIRNRAHILSGHKKVNDKWIEDRTRAKALKHDPDYYKPYGMRHTWASVVYNLTLDVKYVTASGGWATSSSVPIDVYTKTMRKTDALEVAKKWEIYIDPEYRQQIKTIETGVEKEARPTGVLGQDELQKLWQQLEENKRLTEEMAKRIQELEGKK